MRGINLCNTIIYRILYRSCNTEVYGITVEICTYIMIVTLFTLHYMSVCIIYIKGVLPWILNTILCITCTLKMQVTARDTERQFWILSFIQSHFRGACEYLVPLLLINDTKVEAAVRGCNVVK